MSKGEIIDVLDEAGQVIGTLTREEAERNNHITENVLIFVFNSSGFVWAQLRPAFKNHYPGRWDISACGGVQSGETHAEAALREVLEEMGLELELHHVEDFLNVFPGDSGEERSRLSHVYVGFSDEVPRANDEVDEFRDWHPAELRADIESNPDTYTPSFIVELDKALEGYRKLLD